PILEDAGVIGAGGQVLNPAGQVIGQVQNDAGGHPNGFVDTAGVAHAGRLRRGIHATDSWKRLGRADSINVCVVWLAQVERRLSAAVPNRPVKPVIYSGGTWREVLLSPTNNGGAGF